MNTAIISLGTNSNPEDNISKARTSLLTRFKDIRFSTAVYTEPENIPNPALFLNQVAILHTTETFSLVREILKSIEKDIGRNIRDKITHRITIDLDIIQWNGNILKNEDFQRPYIIKGIEEIRNYEL